MRRIYGVIFLFLLTLVRIDSTQANSDLVQQNLLSYDSVIEDGIDGADGLQGVWHSAISPDGKHLYTAGFDENKVGVYARDTDGNLSFIEVQENGVNGVTGLGWVGFIYISPDGAYLYTAAWNDDAVAVFSRDSTTGKLTPIEVHIDTVNGVSGINNATSIAMSQDGQNIYVTGMSSNAVATFDRDPTTGKLTYKQKFVHSRLSSARSVIISPDNSHVYVAAAFFGSIMVFDRDMATGVLTFNEIIENGVNGVDGLGTVWWITMSDDGKFIYAAGNNDDAISLFSRDLTTGKLTYMTMYQDGVDGISNLNGVSSIALVSIPNSTTQNAGKVDSGKMDNIDYLLVTSIFDGLTLFLLDPVTGFLTLLEIYKHDALGVINRLNFASSIAVGPGGNFYVTGAWSDALSKWSFTVTTPTDETPQDDGNANSRNAATNLDPINTFNGELFSQKPKELNLGGPMSLYFQRYYSSYLRRSFIVGDLGSNWRHNFDARLVQLATGNQYKYVSHEGRVTEFLQNPVNNIWEQQTNLDTPYQITIVTGQDAVLYDPEVDRIFTFDFTTSNTIIGKLTKIADGKGNTHSITYNLANGQIQTVSDAIGRTLNFTYNNDAIPKISVVDDGTRSISFQYTDPIDTEYLTIATDARLGATTYVYKNTSTVADHGLMISMTRPAGNTPFTQTFFDTNTSLSSGRVATQTDSDGNTYGLVYNGLETTLNDPSNNNRVHTHTSTGEFSHREDENGLSFALGQDSNGRRNSLTDRLGDTTSIVYNVDSGGIEAVTNPDGSSYSYTYSPRINSGVTFQDITSIIHADANTESFVFDAAGNQISHTNRTGDVTTATFNSLGQTLTSTNAVGGGDSNTYNADATLATSTDAAGNTTSFNYDALRRLDSLIFADASMRSFTLDNADNLLSTTNENGNTVTMSYDLNSNLTTVQDALLNTASFSYDGNDRLLSVVDPLGGVASQSYNSIGKLNSVTDVNGNTQNYGYNTLGRRTSVIDPIGNTWSTTFDLEGIISTSTDPLANTSVFVSDNMGRITRITSPLGNTSDIGYNSMGQIVSTTNAAGETTSYTRDANGLLAAVSLPGNSINVSYSRNKLGLMTQITDPRGNNWLRSYDSSGRLTAYTDPLGNSQTMNYNNRNRVALVSFPGGLGSQTLAYDPAGNLSSSDYSDGTSLAFTYDANSRLTSANGMVLAYDGNNRLTASNGIAIIRDPGGRITQMTLAPGKLISYAYDANDRLTQITDWLSGITTFNYNAAGNLININRPNGVHTSKGYDNDSRLLTLSEGNISSITLTRNAIGEIAEATRNVPLTASATNFTSTVNSVDAASQLDSASYDALGRTLNDGTYSFTWNLNNNLTSMTDTTGAMTYTYDTTGKRLTKTGAGMARSYIWNYALALTSISVEQENGSDLRYYIHTPGGALLYRIDAATNNRQFYHYDEMGNTVFVTDDAGTVTGSYAYAPFGKLFAQAGNLDNLFTWQGRLGIMNDGNGIYYIRARYYDAGIGRFISRDAVKSIEPGKINPYQYSVNNPFLLTDPSGNAPTSVEFSNLAAHHRAAAKSLGDGIGRSDISTLKLGILRNQFISMAEAFETKAGEAAASESTEFVIDEELRAAKLIDEDIANRRAEARRSEQQSSQVSSCNGQCTHGNNFSGAFDLVNNPLLTLADRATVVGTAPFAFAGTTIAEFFNLGFVVLGVDGAQKPGSLYGAVGTSYIFLDRKLREGIQPSVPKSKREAINLHAPWADLPMVPNETEKLIDLIFH